MEYEVHIYKASDPDDVHVEHYAARNTVVLSYLGGDSKTQPIVGSELRFTLEVLDGADGKYLQYFTPDEKEWVVEKRISITQEVIWKGYLLPESYSEPYTYPTFYPGFAAVDGLGLLKGKELDATFYKDEKTVIEVLMACIKLTGIDFDFYFSPAIKNSLKDNWKDIFVDTRHFIEKQKKGSAYEFLEDLVASLQCQLFQSEGKWFLEGINKRHLPKVTFYKYSYADGSFLGTVELSKNIKLLSSFLGEATVSMVPALGKVTVTHPAAELKVVEELVQEENTPWILPLGIDGKFNARHWDFTYYDAFINPPDHYLVLEGAARETVDLEKFIALKEKPFVIRGTKVKIELEAEFSRDIVAVLINDIFEQAGFINSVVFRITLGDKVLFFNDAVADTSPEYFALDSTGKGKLTLDFVAQEDGLLNIELFQPFGYWDTTYTQSSYRITKLTVEDIDQQDDAVYTEIIAEGSSQKNDIDLEFSDDVSGNSRCFYLERVREFDASQGIYTQVPILYGRQIDGKNYSIINLVGAVLIETYPEGMHWQQSAYPVRNPIIHYNFLGGNEIAVETEDYFSTNAFWVNVAKYKAPLISRLKWLEWTDAVFGIEKKPYAQVVAEIHKRLFFKPHIMLSGTVPMPVKFNDLLKFTYKEEIKYFVPTNVDWFPDENESSLTLIEGIYAGESLGNIPPFVEAGPDIILGDGETTAQISEAFIQDNDGFIASQVWEIIAGDAGATFSSVNALNPLLSNLTGNSYTARLTATDNLGASASDTMQIIRVSGYTLVLTPTYSRDYVDRSSGNWDVKERKWAVSISPDAPGNPFINMGIIGQIIHNYNGQGNVSVATDCFMSLRVNGQRVFYTGNNYAAYKQKTLNYSATISFAEEDVVELEIVNKITIPANGFPGWGDTTMKFKFNTSDFVVGSGSLTNLPLEETLYQMVQPRNL